MKRAALRGLAGMPPGQLSYGLTTSGVEVRQITFLLLLSMDQAALT